MKVGKPTSFNLIILTLARAKSSYVKVNARFV